MPAMSAPFFDTLRFVERLQGAGVPEPQAKAEVEILRDILAESLVTRLASKEDIRGIRDEVRQLDASTKEDIRSVRDEIRQLDASTKEDIRGVRDEIRQLEAATKEDFRSVREDFRRLEASTQANLAALEHRMTIKLGSMLFLALGAFYTLTRLR